MDRVPALLKFLDELLEVIVESLANNSGSLHPSTESPADTPVEIGRLDPREHRGARVNVEWGLAASKLDESKWRPEASIVARKT